MTLNKPWQDYDPGTARRLPGTLGVYEIGDSEGNVLYVGFAGGKSRFGLRGEIMARFDPASPQGTIAGQARKLRYEVNMMYMTRFVELLERHQDATGVLPAANTAAGEYVPSILKRRRSRYKGPQGGA